MFLKNNKEKAWGEEIFVALSNLDTEVKIFYEHMGPGSWVKGFWVLGPGLLGPNLGSMGLESQNYSKNIWDKLFSISIFQGIFTSGGKIFVSGGGLSAGQ